MVGDPARPTVRTALLVVDVQGTFADDVPDAGLPVPGSGATVNAIRTFTLAAAALPAVVEVITSQDWHPPQLPGHIAGPGEVPDPQRGLFPRHGVAGTPQAELHPDFATPDLLAVVTRRVRKGQSGAAFSAFEGSDDEGHLLADILASAAVERAVVYGWELANCVSATALSARRAGLETWVVPGLCSVLEPMDLPATLAGLRRHGVELVDPPERALAALAGSAEHPVI